MGRPVSGWVPSSRSPLGCERSSSARPTVSAPGARAAGPPCWCELLRPARARPVPLEVRPVPADAENDPVSDLERVDLARVDGAQVRHELTPAPGAGPAAEAAAP